MCAGKTLTSLVLLLWTTLECGGVPASGPAPSATIGRQLRGGLTFEEMGLRERGGGQTSVLLGGISVEEQKHLVGENGKASQPSCPRPHNSLLRLLGKDAFLLALGHLKPWET